MNSHLLKQFNIADARADRPRSFRGWIGRRAKVLDSLIPFAEVERDPLLGPIVIEFVRTKAPLGER